VLPIKRLMTPVLPVTLLLLPFVLTACSQEEPASVELAAIEAAYEESELERAEKLEAFIPQYQAMAEEYWGTEAALDARLWLMARTPKLEDKEAQAAAIAEHTDAIFERYARSPHMEKLGGSISSYSEEQIAQYFGELRQNSPHAGVRAAAIYYPASRKLRTLRSSEDEEAAGLRAAIEADLQLLVDEYGDVPLKNSTYGIMADAHVNAHSAEALAIGQPAPEIIAMTADGEEIRLSDFLGKVTVIDFWGDW
jgi:hypothetical protein